MTALERLRARELFRNGANPEPTEPTKPPFDGFVGMPPAPFQNICVAVGPANREITGDDAGAPRLVWTSGAESIANNEETVEGDPRELRRRTRALAILAEHSERSFAVVAEAGDPAHVTVAIRGITVGELTIPADRYDGFALLALMQQYGHA